ncbi:MAG: SRPBCC family protein [Candidatus Omnitrophica bacterium]|nr:SRPBCC family protein [Candidatus Omnitrophota bacterium]
MKIFTLTKHQFIPIPIEKAWEFFSNPHNLSEITPPDLALNIKTNNSSKIYSGMLIEYNVKPLFGLSCRWLTEIKHVCEPYFFIDEQRFGPYKFWYHQHFFKPVHGGVEIEDVVHYAIPFPGIDRLMNRWIVRKKLEQIFEYRRRVINNKFAEAEGVRHE